MVCVLREWFSRYSLTTPRWLFTLSKQRSGPGNHTTHGDVTFYVWLKTPVTDRDWSDAHLTHAAVNLHAEDPAYGHRFISEELPALGITASERRVWRLCFLDEEVSTLDSQMQLLVSATAPTLVSRLGIGTGHAAQFLVTAGQNVDRLRSEAAFARLCGAAPIPVSSGKTHRMRLHRGGDRQASRALHMIAVCRLRYDPRTIEYMQRRITDGLSKKDVLRCLKRFIAREVFNDLKTDIGLT